MHDGLAGPPTSIMAVFALSRPLFSWLTREDRPLEWAQFALCLLTGLPAAGAAVRFGRGGRRVPALLAVLLALGMLGPAGEEISWGQRVLGIGTPEGLAGVNAQAETIVHDIEVGISLGNVFKILEFLICLGGIGLALAVRGRPGVRAPAVLRRPAPLLATIPCFAAMALSQAAQFLVLPADWDAVARLQELVEVGLYLALAVLALSLWTGRRATGDGAARDVAAWDGPLSAAELRFPIGMAGLSVLVTLVCAVLSAFSGIEPGNV